MSLRATPHQNADENRAMHMLARIGSARFVICHVLHGDAAIEARSPGRVLNCAVDDNMRGKGRGQPYECQSHSPPPKGKGGVACLGGGSNQHRVYLLHAHAPHAPPHKVEKWFTKQTAARPLFALARGTHCAVIRKVFKL